MNIIRFSPLIVSIFCMLFCNTRPLLSMSEEPPTKRQRLSPDKIEYYQEINQNIIEAIEQDDITTVRRFLTPSVPQQIIEQEFYTSPVELCAIISEFLPSVLNLNIPTKMDFYVLHAAVEKENIDLVRKILEAGANPNISDNLYHQTALHIAARKGNTQLIALLIGKKANIDARDGKGETPLHKAVRHAHEDSVDLLIRENANPFIKSKSTIAYPCSKTPRELALQQLRRIELLKAKLGPEEQERQIEIAHYYERFSHIKSMLDDYEELLNN